MPDSLLYIENGKHDEIPSVLTCSGLSVGAKVLVSHMVIRYKMHYLGESVPSGLRS